jgi:hypothetical protein
MVITKYILKNENNFYFKNFEDKFCTDPLKAYFFDSIEEATNWMKGPGKFLCGVDLPMNWKMECIDIDYKIRW